MGIKNFTKLVNKYAPDAIKTTKITDYSNKILGIDANLMIYKSVYAIRKNGYDIKNNGKIVTHIYTLINKLIGFKKYNITPVFVFDGKPPALKYKTLEQRKSAKSRSIKKHEKQDTDESKRMYYYMQSVISCEDIEECKEVIKLFGYQVIEAPEEADAELAQLYKTKLVNYIVSDDMDILLFGGGKVIKNFTVDIKKTMNEIDLDVLLNKLKMTQAQLITTGILLGSDYCDNKPISATKAYKLVTVSKTNYKTVIKTLKCEHAIKYFESAPVVLLNKIDKISNIDKNDVTSYLKKHKFSDEYVNKILSIFT